MMRFVSLTDDQFEELRRRDEICADHQPPEGRIAEFLAICTNGTDTQCDCENSQAILVASRTRRQVDRKCNVLFEAMVPGALEFDENPIKIDLCSPKPNGVRVPFALAIGINRKSPTKVRIYISQEWQDPAKERMATLALDIV